MFTIYTIAKRELGGFFYSPIAYIVMFLFLILMGLLFAWTVLIPGRVADMSLMFLYSRFGLFFIVPAMTMGMIAEEIQSGRMEMLRTSPLTDLQLVLGKFCGAMLFYIVLLGVTLLYLLLLAVMAHPDYGAVVASYLGMLLMGAMFIAIGLFFSALTQNQLVALLASLIVLGVFSLLGQFKGEFPESLKFLGLTLTIRPVINYLSVGTHMEDFAKGTVDTAHVAYFLAFSLFFMFLTYLVLESRKWR